MIVAFEQIPTYDYQTDTWSLTDFKSQEDLGKFLDSVWNDDCDYKFDESTVKWRESAAHFDKHGCYTFHAKGSKERKEFWRFEGKKCVRGVIWKNGNKIWYLTRDYYWFLNFCRFANKEKGDIDSFADIRDIQYHLSLYEKRAEVHHKHSILTKKRQMASSLIHCAKILNKYWFDRNAVNKIFASDETFINIEKGIWKFLIMYKDFLNEHTDWKRNNQPDQEFAWVQQKEIKTKDGQKLFKGRKSSIAGLTLKIKPGNGVGGACAYGYHEEAGMAPKMDITYGFFRPATEAGIYTTGMFIAAGSVGDLKQCEPLRKYMFSPKGNNFLAVTNSWVDKNRTPTETGLYIPEHWGMPGFIDQYGNSKSEEAYQYLVNYYDQKKKDPEVSQTDYQLELSQHPIYLKDAFKNREVSEFPVSYLQNQQERIEVKDKENLWSFKPRKGLFKENGELYMPLNIGPEHEYPIKPTWPDKRGRVTIYEEPDTPNPEKFTYFAGVDTVEADDTTTSDSVMTVYIYKTVIEVTYRDKSGKIKTRIEGDKIVATYVGRFGSTYGGVEAANEQAWLLIKKYNAFAFVERNKPNFINYMQRHGRAEQYLAKESDVPMFKDMNLASTGGKSKFGFVISPNKKDDNMWKLIKSYIKEYLLAEYDRSYKGDTDEVLKIFRGVDRIDDYWLLEELISFSQDGNFDRIVAFGAALIIAKIYQQNRFIKRRNEVKSETKPVQRQPKQVNMLGGGFSTKKYTGRKPNKPRSIL